MATAVKVPVEDFGVQLTLTRDEAEVLYFLVGKVNGTSDARKLTDKIYFTLESIFGDWFKVRDKKFGEIPTITLKDKK